MIEAEVRIVGSDATDTLMVLRKEFLEKEFGKTELDAAPRSYVFCDNEDAMVLPLKGE